MAQQEEHQQSGDEPDAPANEKKRGRPVALTSKDEAFDKLCDEFPWLDAERRGLYLSTGMVSCSACKCELGGVASNLRNSHGKGSKHVASWSTLRLKRSGAGAGAAAAAAMVASLAAPAEMESLADRRRASGRILRGLLSARVTAAVPPAAMKTLYGGAMLAGARELNDAGYGLGEDATMARDRAVTLAALYAKCTEKIGDGVVCVIIDAAGSSLVGGCKPIAVMVGGAGLAKPVLLGVVMTPPADGSAAACAPLIAALLARRGIDIKRSVVGVMGDNVAWNGLVTELLGLPRFRCIPHGMQLVFKALTEPFPLFNTLTTCLTGVLSAGGTTKRAPELEERLVDEESGICIKASSLAGYSNRWATCLPVSVILLRGHGDWESEGILNVVSQWLIDGKTLARGIDVDAPPVGDAVAAAKATGARGALAVARAAYANPLKALDLHIVNALTPHFDEMLTDACSNEPPLSLLPRLCMYEGLLRRVAQPGEQDIVIEDALVKCNTAFSAAEKAAIRVQYRPVIVAGASAALEQFNDKIKPGMAQLVRRRRFDPRVCPDPLPPVAAGQQRTLLSVKSALGCAPELVNVGTIAELDAYVVEWPRLTDADKAVPMHEFWRRRKRVYPSLSLIGMWYAAQPTSEVACERAFGQMRVMEASQRHSMELGLFEAELAFRVNDWLLEEMYAEALGSFRSMQRVANNAITQGLDEDEMPPPAKRGKHAAAAPAAGGAAAAAL